MKEKRSVILITFTLLLLAGSRAALAQNDRVDEYVLAEMQKRRIPGLSLAVVKNGEVVKAKGYGLANVEHKVPATAETVYQSGSVGKQFTAAAAMLLVEEGKIGLDDKVGKYLEGAPETWKEITIRHLLTHTSGVKNYGPTDLDFRLDYNDDDLVKKAASFPLDFAPGEKWSYSNTGYVLLGVILNKVTGKFYGEFLRERVFAPLGMTTARIITEADIVPNRASGYRLQLGELKNQQYVSPSLNTTADGSLYFTVMDLVKWDAALGGEKLLKKPSFDLMYTPVKLNSGKTHPYGFGWGLGEVNGRRNIEHGGAWQGFTTHIARFVDDKLTVIVLTNLAGASPNSIARGVAGLYVPELRPAERKEAQVDPNTFDAYVGQYQLAPNFILNVTREGDKLMLQATGQPKAQMFPESETKFFFKGVDAQVTFVKDEKGQVTHLILHQGGNREAKKIK